MILFGYVQRKMSLLILAQGQQLAVYKRMVKKPKLKERDRVFWMVLSRILPEWRSRLVIVRPETVIRWSRRRFKDYWQKISRGNGKVGRPQIPRDHINFIKRISSDHPEYGADRIAGILRENFGVEHVPSTVQKYMEKTANPPRGTQQWRTFMKNHASAIWCCDFMMQFTFFFTGVYIFVVMELKSRKIVHFGVTEHPTLHWVKQQIRNATPWGEIPRF